MFAANVFTIIDSQDMQERNRLVPVTVTPGGAQCEGRSLKIARESPVSGRPAAHWNRAFTDLYSACRNRLRAESLPAGWHDER